jgi:P27 family predicted phage terminase small subunit
MKPGPHPRKQPNSIQPMLVPVTWLRPPKHLSELEKDEWRRMVKLLRKRRMITRVDGDALALYVQSYCKYNRAKLEVGITGYTTITATGLKLSPWARIMDTAWEQMRRVLKDFGMTPSSRTKVVAAEKQTANPYEQYLAGNAPMKLAE